MNVQILTGDARALLPTLADNFVQCIVTSPPYLGLRDYQVAGQIGLEQSPEEYVTELVGILREAKRILRDDGTLWLNLGDSYNAHPGQRKPTDKHGAKQATNHGSVGAPSRNWAGAKPKDLLGIPWMVAFALRNDGWYLRSAIAWIKPNPLPESVKDRPTSAYEHVFLLSKQANYYYDADAIAEPMAAESAARYTYGFGGGKNETLTATSTMRTRMLGQRTATGMRNARNVWAITPKPFKGAHFATMPVDLAERCVLAGSRPGDVILDPFGGAGTTAIAAIQHGRQAILIELNPEYVELAQRRVQQHALPDWVTV